MVALIPTFNISTCVALGKDKLFLNFFRYSKLLKSILPQNSPGAIEKKFDLF